MLRTRDARIDIIKGLLTILVVVGHADFSFAKYIFWFHMPLFFMLSGLFFNPVVVDKRQKAKDLLRTCLFPYFLWLTILNLPDLLTILIRGEGFLKVIKYCMILLYGGRMIGGINAVFWFPVCLLIVRLLMLYYHRQLLNRYALILLYISSVIYSMFITRKGINESFCFPYNLDVVPLCIVFYGLGYYLRSLLEKMNGSFFWVIVLLILIFGFLNEMGYYHFRLDMKYVRFNDIIFVAVIPVLFHFFFYYAAGKLIHFKQVTNFLVYLGTNSLVIMYLHMAANMYIRDYLNLQYPHWLHVVIGLVIPIIFCLIINRFEFLSKNLAGVSIKPKPNG